MSEPGGPWWESQPQHLPLAADGRRSVSGIGGNDDQAREAYDAYIRKLVTLPRRCRWRSGYGSRQVERAEVDRAAAAQQACAVGHGAHAPADHVYERKWL